MARQPQDHLADVLEAIAKIGEYTKGGESAFRSSSLVRDAVAARLMQIGQAIKDARDAGVDLEGLAPGVPWRSIAGMRDRLAHRYWNVDHAIVWGVVESELARLERAVRSVLAGKRKRNSGGRSKR